jgi:hypothetical protein
VNTVRTHRVAIIPAATSQEVRFEELEHIGLQYLQTQVGGYVQAVGIPDVGVSFYLNEEGKLEGLPVNARASRLAHRHHAVRPSDFIVGDVVVVGPVTARGEESGLSEQQQDWLSAELA